MATASELAIAAEVVILSPRFADSAWFGAGEADPDDAAFEPGGRVLRWIQKAERSHDSDSFEDTSVYYDAMAYWTLHQLTRQELEESIALGGNLSGPLSSIRTGDESMGFQQTTARAGSVADGQYLLTSWGQRYLAIRNTRPAGHIGLITWQA